MLFIAIRLHPYDSVNFSKALGEYQQRTTDKNRWTCYLLSLVASSGAAVVDKSIDFGIVEDPNHPPVGVVDFAGNETTVHVPPWVWGSDFDIRCHFDEYIAKTEVMVQVSLDENFIEKLFNDLDERLGEYSSALHFRTLSRMSLDSKLSLAQAIEPLVTKNENWSKRWSSFQSRYLKATKGRVLRSMSSDSYTFRIHDQQNDFDFVMYGTFADDWKKWFPMATISTPFEPQWI